ncbi:AAA-domain-containing protein [Dacryopinax primogenitus]|uniref:AAA-domain-containing protein n=1 Tax=Dacryopinax primogenitus (strain DJM 731) TaxID=1858805 RepID=M5FNH8_DACPD|nr:AAA-domain-containing protein [Dacryopinax primogenitus]EJT97470.1 AAA-domain-containing protein [Dacryopinax primogenitus]
MALNSSVTSLWSSHRQRTKINLNSISSPTIPVPLVAPTDALQPGPDLVPPEIAEGLPTAPGTPPSQPPTPPPETSAPFNLAQATVTDLPVSSSRKRPAPVAKASSSKRPKPTPIQERPPPSVRLSQLGGVQAQIDQLLRAIGRPLRFPELYLRLGTKPPRGVLLHGPPGCGKTLLANAVAGELGVPFIPVSAPSVVAGTSGESEKALRGYFEEAAKLAPCILFFDEIDSITPKRDNAQREMERRIVAQLLTCMDEMSWEKLDNKPVIFIAATNRPDSIDSALRRPGRFDLEIEMPIPDENAREQILRVQAEKLTLSGDVDFRMLAKLTPGFVGADLEALITAAGECAADRIFSELIQVPPTVPIVEENAEGDVSMDDAQLVPATKPNVSSTFSSIFFSIPHPLSPEALAGLSLTPADFMTAIPLITPSSKREGFPSPPSTSWSDIGALHGVRQELHMAIVQPIRRPEVFKRLGISAPRGVLLWGPPGNGKTLLARAVASEGRAGFIAVKGPELLNKYVGESERSVRAVFARARASSPCVIFFDEIDALVPRRSDKLSEASTNIVNTLLAELDGLSQRKAIYVIGATNRPDMIDPALLRPGRFDKLVYVDLPKSDERVEIGRTVVQREKVPVRGGLDGEDWKAVEMLLAADQSDGMSGADITALITEAASTALRYALGEAMQNGDQELHGPSTEQSLREQAEAEGIYVERRHFEEAFGRVGRSVGESMRHRYETLRRKFEGVRVRGKGIEEDKDGVMLDEE